MFEAKNLTCLRGGRILFSGLGFDLAEGKALHIKGKNGAGKSSLLNLLAGISLPEEGAINWSGECIQEYDESFKKELLYIGHKAGVSLHLSAEQNLKWYAQLTNSSFLESEYEEVFKRMGLYGFEDIPAARLSAGQRRRIALCRLLIEEKKLWLLDEPLVALDHQGLALFEKILEHHLQQGGIAVLTSHQDINLGKSLLEQIEIESYQFEDQAA
jgi:heme exporter protein A